MSLEDGEPRRRDPASEPPSSLSQLALAVLVVTGYASPLLAAGALAVVALFSSVAALAFLAALSAFVVWILLIIKCRRDMRIHGSHGYRRAGDVLVLAILPVWGLGYAYGFGEPDCIVNQCDGPWIFRPFATPEIYGLIALHALLSLAYAVSRKRPEALRPRAELLVLATLVTGIVVHVVIAVQFGKWLLAGIVLAPVFLPCLSPVLTTVLFMSELRARLRRRGREALQAELVASSQGVYRQPDPEDLAFAPFRVHRGLMLRALAVSPILLGVHAILHALWRGRPAAALDVFTRTCDYTLSQVPIEIVPADCHYLCTVAARGHRWLVRPEREGRRRGVPILVNRQLAIANAFEDLLHERWPRFGRLARRVYDRLGLPVSGWIRAPWLADLVYLGMKPFEWCFVLWLLLLDRESPEKRIDRMYR